MMKVEIKEWIKVNILLVQGKSGVENYDVFEWLIIYVVFLNIVVVIQLWIIGKVFDFSDVFKMVILKWCGSLILLLEKLWIDFNGLGKGVVDRIRQICIGVNDVLYSMFLRVVFVVFMGYCEIE